MYDFMLASFVPVFAADYHMVSCHISETTLYTAIKFHIYFFSRPFGNVYEVLKKSEHFLNFRRKWVKLDEFSYEVLVCSNSEVHLF